MCIPIEFLLPTQQLLDRFVGKKGTARGLSQVCQGSEILEIREKCCYFVLHVFLHLPQMIMWLSPKFLYGGE